MKDKLKEFFYTELHYTKTGLANENDPVTRSNICWYAVQRGLGACQFAQMCGMKFQEVEQMFEEYKMELELLKNEMC